MERMDATAGGEDATAGGEGAPARATRREWLGLAVLALPAMLISLDFTVLNLAVPALSADLQPSSAQLLWIVDIYGFMLAGFLVTMGTVGDRIGRRKLLMIGALAFGAASLFAAFSTSAEMLIIARALLGIAGATLMPSTLSLISNMFRDVRQRTLAIAVWATSLPLGGAIGPLVGGVLIEQFWWGAAFLPGVVVMALLLVIGPGVLPEFRDENAGTVDFASVVLSLAAILPAVYGLKVAAEGGSTVVAVVAIVAGVGFAVLFVRRQRRLPVPLIDTRLFANRTFSTALCLNLLAFFVILGILLLVAQYLQLVLGLSPLIAGVWTVPVMAGLGLGAMATPLLVRRLTPIATMTLGLSVATVGFVVLSQAEEGQGLVTVVVGSAVMAVGMAPVTTLVVNLVLEVAPAEKAGAASGLSETSTELGGAIGIAVLGSLTTSIYRSELTAIPSDVPANAAEEARETLGGAVAVADQLQGSQAEALLRPARDAFTTGMNVTAAICAGIVAALAILTATVLRRGQAATHLGAEEGVAEEAEAGHSDRDDELSGREPSR